MEGETFFPIWFEKKTYTRPIPSLALFGELGLDYAGELVRGGWQSIPLLRFGFDFRPLAASLSWLRFARSPGCVLVMSVMSVTQRNS